MDLKRGLHPKTADTVFADSDKRKRHPTDEIALVVHGGFAGEDYIIAFVVEISLTVDMGSKDGDRLKEGFHGQVKPGHFEDLIIVS